MDGTTTRFRVAGRGELPGGHVETVVAGSIGNGWLSGPWRAAALARALCAAGPARVVVAPDGERV